MTVGQQTLVVTQDHIAINPDKTTGKLTLAADGEIVFNEPGEIGGLRISPEKGFSFNEGERYAVRIDKLEQNLNSLKNYCEAMKEAVDTGFNKVKTGQEASGPNGALAFNKAISPYQIVFNDMADKKIKQ